MLNVYTSPGTWTKAAGLKAIKVTVVGGGASGGTGATVNPSGGGGGTAIKTYPGPSIPGPQPYTVGAVTSSPAPGPTQGGYAGNTSSFGVAPLTVITGSGGSNTPTGAGGAASGGDLNIAGGPSFELQSPPGTLLVSFGGKSMFGQKPSTGYGVGGSRAEIGAPGVVIVEEFY